MPHRGSRGAALKITAFDFELPNTAIARYPAPERDGSRLMTVDRSSGRREHRSFFELPGLLRPGDLLVVNRSKVLPARLVGVRPGGGQAEVLLVRRETANEWMAMVRPGRRLRQGTRVTFGEGLSAVVLTSAAEGPSALRRIAVEANGETVESALERHGHVPLPPYLRREDGPEDRIRYQTVYAREPGSIAAPTAGLHFTPALLAALNQSGVETAEIILHVGPGTFRPVEADDVRDHEVEAESYEIPATAARQIAAARSERRRVVAVGTTVVRTLESVGGREHEPVAGLGETALVIVPGHRFRMVDALITNFHLPRSSLLLLVAAFAGRKTILDAYAEAVAAGYRFYSYGDAMLIA